MCVYIAEDEPPPPVAREELAVVCLIPLVSFLFIDPSESNTPESVAVPDVPLEVSEVPLTRRKLWAGAAESAATPDMAGAWRARYTARRRHGGGRRRVVARARRRHRPRKAGKRAGLQREARGQRASRGWRAWIVGPRFTARAWRPPSADRAPSRRFFSLSLSVYPPHTPPTLLALRSVFRASDVSHAS